MPCVPQAQAKALEFAGPDLPQALLLQWLGTNTVALREHLCAVTQAADEAERVHQRQQSEELAATQGLAAAQAQSSQMEAQYKLAQERAQQARATVHQRAQHAAEALRDLQVAQAALQEQCAHAATEPGEERCPTCHQLLPLASVALQKAQKAREAALSQQREYQRRASQAAAAQSQVRSCTAVSSAC